MEIYSYPIKSSGFGETAMPKLELLRLNRGFSLKEISGLPFLVSLKAIEIGGLSREAAEELPHQLSGSSVQIVYTQREDLIS
uniref:Uncharacterized protein n=1 Tax=Arundo donax TaxID=35708 RepID=A0A0A8YKA4_ARUDO